MLGADESLSMAVYAVGDIQGCFEPLKLLLEQVNFNPEVDTLWCCGDLVNRGPESLEVLRFLKNLGDACVCVLGNHDLQLLAYSAGGKSFSGDTLDDLIAAPDADDLIEWLRFQPLLHHDADLNWCMVHAGLSPRWSLNKAKRRAGRIEKILRSEQWKPFCKSLQTKDFPMAEPMGKDEKNLFSISVLTRMRFCSAEGVCDWKQKTAKSKAAVYQPWFAHPKAKWKSDCRVLFGHWAALGLVLKEKSVLGLDSGYVWGGHLTLARLDVPKTQLWAVAG